MEKKVFHKNDGYVTPIVLNPFRGDNGVIDAFKEENLSLQRLASIFTFYQNKEFLDGYVLDKIDYSFDQDHTLKKLNAWFEAEYDREHEENIDFQKLKRKMTEENYREYLDYESSKRTFVLISEIFFDMKQFVKENPNSFASEILRMMGYLDYIEQFDSKLFQHGCIYLVCKILSIACKYPIYNQYSSIGGEEKFGNVVTGSERELLKKFVNEIKDDSSHIAMKIHRVERMLECFILGGQLDINSKITVREYLKKINFDIQNKNFSEINSHLPPSFFKPSISLKKVNKTKNKNSYVIVPLTKLSSGERQFLQTMGTFVYHLENLKSINSHKGIFYPNVNLILDEVEICFHPEYQRQFIYRLISVIEKLELSHFFCINILISTHSPFVLSDIPKDNILYLEKGNDVSRKIDVNPFAANVNDVLYQSFFLKKGFVGLFAQKKIDSLTSFLVDGKNKEEWSEESALFFIENIVGEPVLKKCLKSLFETRRKNI